MLIVAIAWMYVVLLMAMTQETILAGITTVFGYGLLPLSVVLYLMATPARRRRNARRQQALRAQSAAAENAAAKAAPADKPLNEVSDCSADVPPGEGSGTPSS